MQYSEGYFVHHRAGTGMNRKKSTEDLMGAWVWLPHWDTQNTAVAGLQEENVASLMPARGKGRNPPKRKESGKVTK